MKWISGQLSPSFISTLKVIFQVPNPTYVERYLKKCEKLYIIEENTNHPVVKEGISYDVVKVNKEIQAE